VYYNTTLLSGKEKREANRNASRQEERIYSLFKSSSHRGFTPEEMHTLSGIKAPLTSIRRAMTNLASENKLIRTPIMRKGLYNKYVHVWKLSPDYNKNMELF